MGKNNAVIKIGSDVSEAKKGIELAVLLVFFKMIITHSEFFKCAVIF